MQNNINQLQNTQNLNNQNDLNNKIQKQYRSLQQFKHFCDALNISVDTIEQKDDNKFIATVLFINNNNNKIKFQPYYKFNPHYYAQYKNIFDQLENYKKQYIITLDGNKNSKIVLI